MRRTGSTHLAIRLLALSAAVNLVLAACIGTQSSPGQGAIATGAGPSVTPASSPGAIRTPRPTAVDPYAGIALEEVPGADVLMIRSVIRVGEVNSMAASSKAVWAATSSGLVRINPKNLTYETVDETAHFEVAASADAVWVASFEGGTVDRFDPTTGKSTASSVVPNNPNAIAILGQTVWVSEHRGGAIAALDAVSAGLIDEVIVGPAGPGGPQGIGATTAGIWVGIPNVGLVVRVDPTTREVVARVSVQKSPCGSIAAQADAVWVSTCADDHYAIRIDPHTNELVAEIDLGGRNGDVVLVDGYPWFPVGMRLVRIDPATNRVDRLVQLETDPKFGSSGATIAFESVWIGGADGVTKARVIRIPIDALREAPSS